MGNWILQQVAPLEEPIASESVKNHRQMLELLRIEYSKQEKPATAELSEIHKALIAESREKIKTLEEERKQLRESLSTLHQKELIECQNAIRKAAYGVADIESRFEETRLGAHLAKAQIQLKNFECLIKNIQQLLIFVEKESIEIDPTLLLKIRNFKESTETSYHEQQDEIKKMKRQNEYKTYLNGLLPYKEALEDKRHEWDRLNELRKKELDRYSLEFEVASCFYAYRAAMESHCGKIALLEPRRVVKTATQRYSEYLHYCMTTIQKCLDVAAQDLVCVVREPMVTNQASNGFMPAFTVERLQVNDTKEEELERTASVKPVKMGIHK